jgi:hypothetical protein
MMQTSMSSIEKLKTGKFGKYHVSSFLVFGVYEGSNQISPDLATKEEAINWMKANCK